MSSYLQIARRLVTVPTAPFREDWMLAALDRELALLPGVECASDGFGNRLVRLRRGTCKGLPITYIAHLDHPGFVFPREGATRRDDGLFEAAFEGRVEERFFPGAAVRLFRSATDEGIRGTIVGGAPVDTNRDVRRILIEAPAEADGAVLGMWDLPAFDAANGLLTSRACDDLAGCAALLEMLRRLADDKQPIDVAVVFSRAEEAGFCGVLAMLAESTLPELIPQPTLFVSVETSGETDPVPVGSGAVIRLGDRTSTFDASVVDLMWGLAKASNVSARRALMDRGTCEATPFARAGHRAGGVCIPLRNYHNMNMTTGRIDAEQVNLDDAEALCALMAMLAGASARGEAAPPPVVQNYDLYLGKARRELARESTPNGHRVAEPVPRG